jgi:hypothetical protein
VVLRYSVQIDRIRPEVPEPATLALLGLGWVGTGCGGGATTESLI